MAKWIECAYRNSSTTRNTQSPSYQEKSSGFLNSTYDSRCLANARVYPNASNYDRGFRDVCFTRSVCRTFASISLLCLMFVSFSTEAQTESVLVSNWTQSVNATSMVDDERLQTFTTGSHANGYVLTRVELDFVLKTTVDSFTVHLWSASGNRPGNRIAILETSEVVIGEPTAFTSSTPVILEPDQTYFLHLAVKHPNDVLILKATKSGAEDRSLETSSWQIADSSIHIPNFGSTAWNSEASVLKIRIFGYERGVFQEGAS